MLVAPMVCLADGQKAAPVVRSRPESSLRVGDLAPPFKVGRWLTGEPVSELSRGRIYVLDFWGTRCAPCIKGFPKLTDIAKRHRDRVTIIGISLVKWNAQYPYPSSSDADQNLIMKKHSASIGYPNAMDTPDGHMAVTWMNASRLGGIPYLMIVGVDGRLAWTGDLEGLENALKKLTTGSADAR